MEYFDASTAHATRPVAELLGDLQRDGTRARLLALLDDVDDQCDRILDEEASRPLDDSLVALLEAVTGAQGAPAHFVRVHDRVENGQTTWDRFWLRPTDEYRGYEIIQEAMALTAQDVDRSLASTPHEETRD